MRTSIDLHRSCTLLAAIVMAAVAVTGCGDSKETASAGQDNPPTSTTAVTDDGSVIGAFPIPGTPTASPQTQISLRGTAPDEIGKVIVTGSKTGAHPGKLKAHSDGKGASFLPSKPFSSKGEKVTVKTSLDIEGANDGSYSFTVVQRPDAGLQSDPSAIDPDLLRALTGQTGKVVQDDPTFKSRKDLRPPEITILKESDETAPGLIFLAPKIVFGVKRPNVQNGPLISEDDGDPVWFAATGPSTPEGNFNRVNDFRVQSYQGKPALTWWQGRQVLGTGEGEIQIVGEDYKKIKTIKGGNGYQLDFHEARITDDGTFLGLVYNPISKDLSSVGGPKQGRSVDAIVQEIDIETGLVLFEWHSEGTIDLEESYEEVPEDDKSLFDYVHVNSARLSNDDNILISGRETWSAMKLDRNTGKLMARIGGKKSDYEMLGDAQFAYQHDVIERPDGTLSIFDNEAAPQVRDQTRGLILKLDEEKKTASVVQEYKHEPKKLTAGTQGNVQTLPNDNIFMEWGSQGYFSEFSEDGELLYDGRIARGQDSYRGYRQEWVGKPDTKPSVAVVESSAYASWNGATEVATWTLLTGSDKDEVDKEIGTADRESFETRITMKQPESFVAMQARDSDGEVLGTSRAVRAQKK